MVGRGKVGRSKVGRSKVDGARILFTLLLVYSANSLSSQGLIEAPGAELVRAHCSACHSLNLVTAQRGDADFWLRVIRWMQRTQNLWVIPPVHERAIIDYLANYYVESEWGRRPELSPQLMPAGT